MPGALGTGRSQAAMETGRPLVPGAMQRYAMLCNAMRALLAMRCLLCCACHAMLAMLCGL